MVYGSITGFGQTGPYAKRPATDGILQAFTGLMGRNRTDAGTPRRIGFPVPDYTTGLMAYQSVSTALYAKAVGQGGRHLDISLMRSMLLFQQQGLVQEAAVPGSSHAPVELTPLPPTGTFETADGPVNISIVREKFFQSLCRTRRCTTTRPWCRMPMSRRSARSHGWRTRPWARYRSSTCPERSPWPTATRAASPPTKASTRTRCWRHWASTLQASPRCVPQVRSLNMSFLGP